MIVATAGHVDHGKTLLVKALTGVDADRLPEEKKRGMTIDLGFAYLPVDSAETIGFIDVPGHERFLHNMLAGVSGIDFVLLLVAADDGPMPQTREHLAILDLLAVHKGAVAVTKVDRVASGRVSEVRNEIAALLGSTTLADAPIFPISALTGEGLGELKDHLLRSARDCQPRSRSGNFRLAIDRCFSVAGAGLIVTGTAVSGSVAAGDQVRVLQAGLDARVRAIHAQNAPSITGRAGQRCALNLSGAELKHSLIGRGDWIVTGGVPDAVSKIDARLRILSSEQKPFDNWTPVHVHVGARDVTGRVAVLEGSSIAPGADALVQLVLDRPVGALGGDRFIVRDQSAARTIGGGRVIDIFPPLRGRAKPGRLAYLKAMEGEDHHRVLASLLEAARQGLNLFEFAATRNLTAAEAAALFAALPMKTVGTTAATLGFSTTYWEKLKAAALEAIAACHQRAPNGAGLAEDRLLSESGMRLPREVATAIAAELSSTGVIVRESSGVRLVSHLPQLSPAEAALWKRVAPLLEQTPLRPPTVHEIATALKEDPKKTEAFLGRAARLSLVARVSQNRYFLPEALGRLRKIAEDTAMESTNNLVTAGAFRDRAKIGRTVAIEVLEFFDRNKVMRRIGDGHQVIVRQGDPSARPI